MTPGTPPGCPIGRRDLQAVSLTMLACGVAGWLAFAVPYEVAYAVGLTRGPTLMDGMQLISLLGVFLIGVAAGAAVPRAWFLWGPCIVAFLPCKAAIEILLDPTSHNLWPVEMAFYAAFALLGVAGAGLGAFARWLATRRRTEGGREPDRGQPDAGGGGSSRP